MAQISQNTISSTIVLCLREKKALGPHHALTPPRITPIVDLAGCPKGVADKGSALAFGCSHALVAGSGSRLHSARPYLLGSRQWYGPWGRIAQIRQQLQIHEIG